MSITFEEVSSFIATARPSVLQKIADELESEGFEFECLECETHVCEEHDPTEDIELAKSEFIQGLIERANQFGLNDMLDDLKREGERVGVFLKAEVKS